MSFFSSPASVPVKQPTDVIDPEIRKQRDAIEATTNVEQTKIAERSRQRYAGRSMGVEGANAFFTGSPAGYGRTMGSANV
jgi:hypothetical protein